MKVHVQGRNGVPGSVSAFDAYLGFRDMGFEVEVFDDPASLQGAPREDVVVGGVGVVIVSGAFGAHLGQQTLTMDRQRELWRRFAMFSAGAEVTVPVPVPATVTVTG